MSILNRNMTIFACLLVYQISYAECIFPNQQDKPDPVNQALSLAGEPQPSISRYLQVRSVNTPILSPNGKRLAYLDQTTGTDQIWVMDEHSGLPRQLSFGSSVEFLSWSHDNDLILYGVDRQGNERLGFYLISFDGKKEKVLLPPSDAYRTFGGLSSNNRYMFYSEAVPGSDNYDIYRLDLVSNKVEMLMPGRMGFYITSISPKGNYLTLSETRGESSNRLYLFDTGSRVLTTLFDPETRSAFLNITWANNEQGFYLATNQEKEYTGPAYYDLQNNKFQFLSETKGDVENLILTEDEKNLIWSENINGQSKIITLSLADNKQLPIPELPTGIYEFSKSETANVIAILIKNSQIPGDVWVWDLDGLNVKRITHSSMAGLNKKNLIEPEFIEFKTRDDITVNGLLYLPLDYSKTQALPALLKVHGGPYAQARKKFNPQIQYLVSRGMAVLDFNYRGSSGFGKEYARLNDFRLRDNELNDLEDAVHWLKSQSRFQIDKVAIEGVSYGGYLTMAALTRKPGLFAAGVASVGVSNWITALEGASPQLKASDREEYGDINDADDREYFKSISPINYVHQFKAALMILHGANDPRDPVSESDEFVCKLRELGNEVVYLRFSDEGHGYQKLSNKIIAYTRTADFLLEHLQ